MTKFGKRAAVAFAVATMTTSAVMTPTAAFAQTETSDEARPRPWWVGKCSKLQWVMVPWMCGTIEIIYW